MSNHSNIAIFVPHMGCPHTCSFCNQRYITGKSAAPDVVDVDDAVKTALKSRTYDPENGQIAFFGGSFTAIDHEYMIRLLAAAKRNIDNGYAASVRISTRPDYIDDDVLQTLRDYGVGAIELGAQSMRDDVLALNERGHTSKQVEDAAGLIKSYGFELGLQMMTGLYGDDDDGAVYTARKFIELGADTVRIYPTLVLEGTHLCKLMRQGVYTPQTVDEAVALGAKLIPMFRAAKIPVIRFGLHTVEQDKLVGGAWHPALAEMVYSRIYLNEAMRQLEGAEHGKYYVYVRPSAISQMTGQAKCNKQVLYNNGYICQIRPDDTLGEFEVKIKREENA